ncbi:MAG: hypothetical protein GC160_10255 [Acidobacteria bacterium]|nr:hypothetical protein [Acidobacteriota bacterium]
MKKIIICTVFALASSALLPAQTPGERPAPSYDELIAHLGLTDSQIACLEANKTAFRETAAPTVEELRSLQRQLRQATRDSADTSAIETDIAAAKATLEGAKTSAVAAAQSCLDASQASALAELVAAETLMREVREGQSLLLLESSGEGALPIGGGRGGRRGPGPGAR